jgi:hypothetical protein
MKLDNLSKAVELKTLLDTTKRALKDLNEKILTLPTGKSTPDHAYVDGPYYLSLSQHADGSGGKVELNRYYGNRSLLQVIKVELERQIAFFEKEVEYL